MTLQDLALASKLTETELASQGLLAGMRPTEIIKFLETVKRWKELGLTGQSQEAAVQEPSS